MPMESFIPSPGAFGLSPVLGLGMGQESLCFHRLPMRAKLLQGKTSGPATL